MRGLPTSPINLFTKIYPSTKGLLPSKKKVNKQLHQLSPIAAEGECAPLYATAYPQLRSVTMCDADIAAASLQAPHVVEAATIWASHHEAEGTIA